MNTTTRNRATMIGVVALGLLLATLLAALLSATPAGAGVVPAGNARSWGDNEYGQLGNGFSGSGAHSPLPVAVKNLTNVRNTDGGHEFTLAAVQ